MKVKVCDLCGGRRGVRPHYLYFYQGVGRSPNGNRKVQKSTYTKQIRLGEFCPTCARVLLGEVARLVDSHVKDRVWHAD